MSKQERAADIAHERLRAARWDRAWFAQWPWLVLAIVAAVFSVHLIDRVSARPGITLEPARGAVVQGREDVQQFPDEAMSSARAAPTDDAQASSRHWVYRCVGQRGEVSLQSGPCGAGQTTTRAIHAPPERVRPRVSVPQQKRTPARPGRGAYAAVPLQPDSGRRARCESAKRERTNTLERVGLARTYDLLQQLDAMVDAACKGV